MPVEQANGFADNWAYLRTELHWLERLLMAAVAKQRKETKEIDRISQSKADRATSHWWKGIITPEGTVSYDEYRQPSSVKDSYNTQLEAQIQASQKQGVILALPTLRDRLGLTLFEKNVVLMSLAPEVNRRYSRLYRYLQGEDNIVKSDLPTLDLVLRLLCKTDQDWRSARNHLISNSRLTRYKLLTFLPSAENTLLNCPLKLSQSLVNYLLADQPTVQALNACLNGLITNPTPSVPAGEHPASPTPLIKKGVDPEPVLLSQSAIERGWSDLVLPPASLTALQALAQQILGWRQAEQVWNISAQTKPPRELPCGLMVLLIGAAGTGKTLAAAALASSLSTPLFQVDLASIDPTDYDSLLTEMIDLAPTVLLIRRAEFWLKRSSLLPRSRLQRLWTERRQASAMTLLSVTQPAAVQVHWQRQVDRQIHFPLPDVNQRLQLWQKVFPPQIPLEPTINWQALATQLPLSGGEIRAIGHEAIGYAAAQGNRTVGWLHIQQALAQRHLKADIQPLSPKRPRTRKLTES
jgi:hypothetical protein